MICGRVQRGAANGFQASARMTQLSEMVNLCTVSAVGYSFLYFQILSLHSS